MDAGIGEGDGMESSIDELIRGWEGVGVVARYDAQAEAWFFVALHDLALGPPTGGCRMQVYERPEDGLLDAMRLARGMTYKWAAADLPFGGGKSVIALSRPIAQEERAGVFRRFGRFLEALSGAYRTGEDLGTTPEDMATIAGESRYVHGLRKPGEAPVDPGPYTARGVLAGMRAAAAYVLGSAGLTGTSVLVQGTGDVGAPLARLLRGEGARLLLSDLDEARVAAVAAEVDGEVVPPERVYDTECDVFAPCAVGAVLGQETIPRLRCRIVAGSANNQLREDADAGRLRDRGIVYVPDFIVNAGGAIALPLLDEGRAEAEILERIDRIGTTVVQILEESVEKGESPLEAARRIAERRLRATSGEPARPLRR